MTVALQIASMSVAQEERSFPFGRFELFSVGGQQVGRAVYAPGWRWSEHVAPTAGTPLCEVEHVGLVLSGRAAVKIADGTEFSMGPGDLFSIPAGHDSWVLGDEEYVSLHFLGVDRYARKVGETGVLPDGAPVGTPVGKHNALFSTWGEGCGSWTLLARSQLHILQERMPPGTSEQRHRHADTVQCYYILDGTAVVEVAGTDAAVGRGEGIELPAGAQHRIRNDGAQPVEFLVVSSQPPRHDRAELP